MPNRFAISDVHGCPKSLKALVQRLHLQEGDHLYLLGDYIDRGPGSKEVLDYLISLQEAPFQVTMLRGNHEQLMLDGQTDKQTHELWRRVGGWATLNSMGIGHASELPKKYLDFINDLTYYVKLPDYYLVHGGFNLALPNPFGDPYSMMNLRDFYVDDAFLEGRKIIRGHVPTMLNKIRDDLAKSDLPIITIDNGCVYAEVWGLGNLLAFDLETQSLIVQPCIDDVGQ